MEKLDPFEPITKEYIENALIDGRSSELGNPKDRHVDKDGKEFHYQMFVMTIQRDGLLLFLKLLIEFMNINKVDRIIWRYENKIELEPTDDGHLAYRMRLRLAFSSHKQPIYI